jgi:hypothetical protein
MWSVFYLTILLSFTGCDDKPVHSDSKSIFESPKALAELTDPRLMEPSGIASSTVNPGMLWTHNDSGNKPEVYLIDQKLNIKLTCKLKGVMNRDWEDIAVGPGPEEGKTYVYVGEIGDNFGMYPFKYIYRFEEPVLENGVSEITISDFEKITFRLEDSRKDTETLLVHPITKKIYVVSKREEPVWVYELSAPQPTKDTLTASKAFSLPLTQIVGGDFSADGKELLMKNYQQVFYWELSGENLKESLAKKPTSLPYQEEPQGEAITFSSDGKGYFTLSEKVKEYKSYLYFYSRK